VEAVEKKINGKKFSIQKQNNLRYDFFLYNYPFQNKLLGIT
jgi:hypothetical protein